MQSARATSTSWISSSSCLNAVRHTPWVSVRHLTGREQLLVEADPRLVSPINTACVFLRTVVLALFKPGTEKHSKIYNESDSDAHTNKALIHRMFRQDAPSFLLLLAMKLRAAALGLHTVVSDFQYCKFMLIFLLSKLEKLANNDINCIQSSNTVVRQWNRKPHCTGVKKLK